MNLKEYEDSVDAKLLAESKTFYRRLFSTLTTNQLMFELKLCPKLIMDMDQRDYHRFAVIVNETARTLRCK